MMGYRNTIECKCGNLECKCGNKPGSSMTHPYEKGVPPAIFKNMGERHNKNNGEVEKEKRLRKRC
jgi:hypothetical protein